PSSLPIPNISYLQGGYAFDTQGSSSEDFRSVIDDLTVENKKLKRKLKKYEKLYDAHLQQEKLFEIRVHGLPAQKKRELEETLRKFALSLEQSPPTASMTSGYTTSTPALDQQRTASSHTSTRFADSAYVSNSASAQQSATHSTADPVRKAAKATATRNHDIQTYLHDIPAALLPKQPVAMTEKAKKKLVVRRLEQIFAGKGAAVGGHQQPLQQQEVSQSAAAADRMAIEATGQQAKMEGLREARIMSKGNNPSRATQVADLAKRVQLRGPTGKDSPEQRPTRPLDLDLHRAQVPSDNLQYIRHLGFSPADLEQEQADDHGWIYLNVLTNMAQMHTLNVTAEFVRKSIADYSSKLQLSRDGRKARWKGGQDVTQMSSDGSPATGTHSPTTRLCEKVYGTKRSFPDRTSSGHSSGSPAKASRSDSRDKLAYVPLFFHKPSQDDEEESSEEHVTSWGSPQQEHIAGNSSGLTSSGIRTNSSKRKRGDDGPIIFYNKAKFCTDLSGDQNERGAFFQPSVKYSTIGNKPVGMAGSAASNDGSQYYAKGPLGNHVSAEDAMDVDGSLGESSESEIRFSPKTEPESAANPASSPTPMDFEVSGLGGVQPSDHFKIEVQSRRKSNVGQVLPNATHFKRNKVYPRRILQILGEDESSNAAGSSSRGSPAIEEEVVSTSHKELPVSALPEPAMLFTGSSYEEESDSSSDGSGAESDISSFDDGDRPAPSAA
ncbi:MAG: hypothetical protein INR71_09195, partial [Terriglobus roseus]|nr:hypothetical protein [Terriglobus roseus]